MKNIDAKINEFIDLINNSTIYEDKDYISSLIMTSIIPRIINVGMSTNEMKEYTKSIEVSVTEEEIITFLNQRFEIENKEVKDRIEKRNKLSNNILEDPDFSYDGRAQRFIDDIIAIRYSFNSYTLEYFKRYVSILKIKIAKLFKHIDDIQSIALGRITDEESINNIINELAKYDIKVLPNGDIYYQDMIRLLTPLMENIILLMDKINEANQIETYLNFSVSKEKLYRDGLFESELYPKEELQVPSLYYNKRGCIRLSEKQREELLKQNSDNFCAWLKVIDDATTPKRLVLEPEKDDKDE